MPGETPMTMERLQFLLDAYGANRERWPEAERDSASALLAASEEARALVRDAARLDALLDFVSAPDPSPALIERALASAPAALPVRRRVSRRGWQRLAFAAAPLAAAAALMLWLLPSEQVDEPAPQQYAIEDLGVYTTPTDVLLDPPGFDLSDSAPSLGCERNGLGCPLPEDDDQRESHALGVLREEV